MGMSVVFVDSGGMPVTEATLGTPITIAGNGRGIAVTRVASGGLPVVTTVETTIGSPSDLAGLVFAVRPDQGVVTSGGNVTSAAGAWGTSVTLTGASGKEPDQAVGLGPANQNLFKFTKATPEYFTMSGAVTLGACTVFMVVAPNSTTANTNIFTNSVSATNLIGFGTGSPVTTLRLRANGGAAQSITLSPALNKMLNIVVVTYDGIDTATAYINGISAGSVSGLGAAGFVFDQIGASITGTAPFDGHMGPLGAFNRVLNATEIAALVANLAAWRGSTIYAANAGSNSSITPWNQTTPYQTLSTAFGTVLYGDETVAPKGGDLFRLTAPTNASVAGKSAAIRGKVNGALWGTGKAQTRGSVAPTLTNTSGTIYSSSALAAKPVAFAYYIPGGTITFGSNFTLGSMQRLTENTGTPTTPGVGEWGWDGISTAYFNAGVALTTGDIEVALTGIVGRVLAGGANWALSNISAAFMSGTGFATSQNNISVDGFDVYFTTADGIDCGVSGPALNFQVSNCIVAWCGDGSTSLGAAAGDGYSVHDVSTATFTNCQSWRCDKAGFDHHNSATVVHDRCLAVGSAPFNILNTATVGSTLTTNSIGVTINGAANAFGFNSASTVSTVTIENCTFYSQSSPAAGSGVLQNGAGGSLTSKNNIVKGFATGLNFTAGGTLRSDHNDYHGNTANYSGGVLPGVGDITLDPQLSNAAGYDFSLLITSPCKLAGIDIAGIGADYAGSPRASPPTIGAYN